MPNLRIVYDNVANDATLTASSTAGSLGVNNLKTDTKAEVWRSVGTSATLTMQWASAELTGMVALPFCSLSSAATIRVRGYIHAADSAPALDTGVQMACSASQFGNWDWGMIPLGVNGYSYGGSTYGVIWFPVGAYEKLVVDLSDASNPLGYIEASRLVTGTYWSPVENADYGIQLAAADTSKSERNDAGDLKTDRGSIHKTLSFDLAYMPSTDRNSLWNILRGNGLYRAVFISLVPEADDPIEEQTYQIYGKLSKQSAIRYQFANQHNATIEIEEM
jgi:hypothetical protein